MMHLEPLALSGSSDAAWATVAEVWLSDRERPACSSFLCVEIVVREGLAGIGWYDNDGLAEEIYISSSAEPRTVWLTVWQPQQCERVIARNVRKQPVSLTMTGIGWRPIDLAEPGDNSFTDAKSDGLFLDQEFVGQPSETLWRRWRNADFDTRERLGLLRRLIHLAWEQCPGYRDHWQSHGWNPSKLRAIEDAAEIPIITKDAIRSDVDAFTVSDTSGLYDFTTSGTTGAPFSFKYTELLNAAHLSAVAIGASYGDDATDPWRHRALIIKRSIRGPSATGAGGSLLLNAAAVNDAGLVRQLVSLYKPTLLFGWPSYATSIAEALRNEYEFRVAVLGSENIFDAQVREASKVAKAVVGTYGLSEGAGFAMRCRGCGAYTELDTHGMLRFHPRPDGLFDIIGTSFWSLGTLFINYDTGDITHGPAEACPQCPAGHSLRFKVPAGRSQEFVVDRNGGRHALAMIVGAGRIVRLLRDIELFDFVQTAPGNLTFRYVTESRQPIDEQALIHAFQTIIGDDFEFRCRHDARIVDLKERQGTVQKWKVLKRADIA